VKKRIRYINTKWQSLFIGIFLVITFFSTASIANNIDFSENLYLTYNFKNPVIKEVEIAGSSYDKITMNSCLPAGNIGEPLIPSKGVFILLPPKSKVLDIHIITKNKQDLGFGYYIEPMGEPIPISNINNKIVPIPDKTIYNSNELYPGKLHTKIGIYNFRGYQILVLLLHPIQYNPLTGELFYYKNLDIEIKLEYGEKDSNLFRGFTRDRNEVLDKVDNPELVDTYNKESISSKDEYELLILTSDSLKDGFTSLKDTHDNSGTPTVIKTLTDVGSTDLEDIRNYIIDAYTNWGIDFVLIGGDTNIIPAPMLWVYGLDEETWPYETYMPSDLFYSCLDGTYNYDGDNKWGEPTDGNGGTDVDLFAEVYVGRACVGDISEVENFVAKTNAYLNRNPEDEYLSKACFAGENLGDYGIATWGGNYMDQLINGSSDDGYTTVGISAEDYIIETLYDRDYPGNYWPPSEIVNIIEDGVHLINHGGHASYDYNMRLVNYDVDLLENDDLCFIYSQGCNSGGFDEEDSIAEHFTVKTTSGAFAGIWNARYGFFWSFSTDGDSQRFQREFWDAIFGEGLPEIGKANHDSKEDNIPIIGRSMIRWCYYQTNLFGDPSLNILETSGNTAPAKPNEPNGPDKGIPFIKYTFETSTTDPDDDQIYYKWDWGNGEISDWIGPINSGDIFEEKYKWNEKGTYHVKVKAKDSLDAETSWSEPLTVKISFSRFKNRQNTNFRLFDILHIFFHQFL
jgi:hypothetical protein